MSILTNEEYINGKHANCCPITSCQSTMIEGGSISIEGKIAVQEVSCSQCEAVWEDTYTLSSFELTEEPSK